MPLVTDCPETLRRAYRACEAMARSHYENFPVASRLLPSHMRPHVAAVYAFARAADDVADEGTASAVSRQAQLDVWQKRLHDAVANAPSDDMAVNNEDLVCRALAHSIRSLRLPLSLFDDLLSAFRQDTTTTRYASWPVLLDYCRRSANPVGRLVLRIAGYERERFDQSSDALCTALQLTNFWQDLGRDWNAGRLYVPREILDACGAVETDLSSARLSTPWVQAIAICAGRTEQLFDAGRMVCDGVGGRLGLELRLTWLGGRRILERVVARGAQLLHDRPALGRSDLPLLLWQAARWRRRVA